MSMRLLETPVPIPNTTVKRKTAEGTMLVTAWENRRAPDFSFFHKRSERLSRKVGTLLWLMKISFCTLKIAYRMNIQF